GGGVGSAGREERLPRIKTHGGYYHGSPERSVEAALEAAGGDAGSIELIAISNFAFPPLPLRLLALSRSRPLGDKEFLDHHEFSRTLSSRLYSVFSERPSGSALARRSIPVH